jgi:hypothetical protein
MERHADFEMMMVKCAPLKLTNAVSWLLLDMDSSLQWGHLGLHMKCTIRAICVPKGPNENPLFQNKQDLKIQFWVGMILL